MNKFCVFLIGGVLGAGAALAFAPKTGEEARAFVAEKANALAGEAKDFGAGFPGSVQSAYQTAREQGASIVGDATAKVKGATGSTNDVDADELRAKIEAARQRIAAQVMENAEKAQEAAEAVEEAAVETVEEAAEAVEEAAEDAADKADSAMHAAK